MTTAEVAIANMLLTQGLQYWASFQARKADGTLTKEDLDEAGRQLDADIEQLRADIEAQEKQG